MVCCGQNGIPNLGQNGITILTASTLECCYGLLEFFKLLLRTLSCLVAHEHLQYIATDCSFYQTPTPTAAARNESKSGLIISIEKKKKMAHCIGLKKY